MTLPTFLIIGAGKSGTTSLYRYLIQHPDVFMSEIKEPNFFAWDPTSPGKRLWDTTETVRFPVQDQDAYEALFAEAGEASAIGEASTIYLSSAFAPHRIKETIPDARLIVSLRNPVDRAYSGYQMAVRAGRETRPVREAFGVEEHRVQAGLYHRSLKRYYELFPAEQIKVLVFEHWTSNPADNIHDVFAFLGVDAAVKVAAGKRYNVGGIPRNRRLEQLLRSTPVTRAKQLVPRGWMMRAKRLRARTYRKAAPLPAEVRNHLLEFFADDTARLADMTGQDLSVWTQPAADQTS